MKSPNLNGWKCQSEQIVTGQNARNTHLIDQMIGDVINLGLEPAQAERIHEAIMAVVQELARLAGQNSDQSTVLIRLLVPVMGLGDPPCTEQENHSNYPKGSNGPGFFIFEKSIRGHGDLGETSWREVNVLIYGHSHSR